MKDDNGGGVIRMDLKPDQRICNKCYCQVGLSKDKKLKLDVEIFQYIALITSSSASIYSFCTSNCLGNNFRYRNNLTYKMHRSTAH